MDPETIQFLTELAKSVAKDVYGDGFSPAVREAGLFAQDLVKTLRRALPQVQVMAVDQDRYRRFLELSVERVPVDRRIAPAPQLLGPVIEGIRYEPEGSMSEEAFSELLSRAFDRERVDQAHPAFPALIRSLSDDEMRLVRALALIEPRPMDFGVIPMPGVRSAEIGVTYPENVPIYAGHLNSLGLTVQPYGWDPTNFAVMIDDVRTYLLSPWGLAFAAAIAASGSAAASAQ